MLELLRIVETLRVQWSLRRLVLVETTGKAEIAA